MTKAQTADEFFKEKELKKYRLIDSEDARIFADMKTAEALKRKAENGCCMGCQKWTFMQNGEGKCSHFGVVTTEDFYCKRFVQK